MTTTSPAPATDTAFTPTIHDVQATHNGLLIASISEYDHHMIAIGALDPRRALAAFSWPARTICGGPALGTLTRDEMRADLADGALCIVPGMARFCRTPGNGWTVDRVPAGTPGAVPAVWMIPPWHPDHAGEHRAQLQAA